jgi:cytochrome c553
MKKLLVILVAAGMATALAAKAADAKENWTANCAKCHGEDGKGDTKMGKKMGVKDFTDAKVQDSFTDEKAAKSIKEGVKEGDKTLMQPYGDKLSDADIKALVAHIRSFKK